MEEVSNKCLLTRYEDLRTTSLEYGVINMEQKYLIENGMFKWILKFNNILYDNKDNHIKSSNKSRNISSIFNKIIASLILSIVEC